MTPDTDALRAFIREKSLKPVVSVKRRQKKAAQVMASAMAGRPMTNKAAKKWIKRELRRATR